MATSKNGIIAAKKPLAASRSLMDTLGEGFLEVPPYDFRYIRGQDIRGISF